MIQTLDLRIGNLVEFIHDGNTAIGAVCDIREKYVRVDAIFNGSPNMYLPYSSQLQGLPLEEKNLLYIGFDGDPNYPGYYCCPMDHQLEMRVDTATGLVSSGFIGETADINRYKNIKFIHQLQNLYYVLTGNDLKYSIEQASSS